MDDREHEKTALSKPGHDYVDPDLPDGEIDQTTRYVLELYAHEIREHVTGLISIAGLSPTATAAYKQHVFDAADHLEAAAKLLRQNNRIRHPVVLTKEVQAEKGWFGLLKKIISPMLLTVGGGEIFFQILGR